MPHDRVVSSLTARIRRDAPEAATMRPLILGLGLVLATSQANAQTTRYFDEQGRLTARAEQHGATTRFYDARGRTIGRAETRNGTTRHYDSAGRLRGRSETRASARPAPLQRPGSGTR